MNLLNVFSSGKLSNLPEIYSCDLNTEEEKKLCQNPEAKTKDGYSGGYFI